MPKAPPHRLLQTVFLLLLCLTLLLPSALAAKNPDRADIRVSLRRLNLTDAVWMTLEGRYLARCADGAELLLPAGANVTVFLRGGKLILFSGGVSAVLGEEWLNKDCFRFGVSRLGNSLMSAIEQKTVSFF